MSNNAFRGYNTYLRSVYDMVRGSNFNDEPSTYNDTTTDISNEITSEDNSVIINVVVTHHHHYYYGSQPEQQTENADMTIKQMKCPIAFK